ncbi:MAG: hypothetical protein DMG08_26330 [Acidobacteria bacterium]|nr:MAG: hypothetical protein DMG08_26330 [Acidobacteriota bacterium]
MSKWAYFLWLFRQAADGLLYMWPVTVALCCMLSVAVLRSRSKAKARPRGGWWLQLTPLGVPIAVLALGTVFACENCSPSSLGQGVRHIWAMHAVDVLLVIHLTGAVGLVMLAEGARLVSSALQAILLWCSFWASFLAGMSMSGDWL